jgi:hypothetical protein
MRETDDTDRSGLNRTQRRQLRDLGWRGLGRRRAKRPRAIRRRHLVDADVDEATTLVDLETSR